MTSIQFTYPWLLLVAIPLIGLSLIPYFKIGKKYRRTRNRIVSLVLHCVTIVLVTLALSGLTFVHSVSNTANELLLVVDMSDTQNEMAENRDGFINDVLKESVYQNFTVGVVTFGLNQVYAVPLTSDAGSVYSSYLKAELPDTSATDIEAALEFARTLFNHPESGKIVLVTDGKETDGNVISSSVASSIVAQGTRLDTVYISSAYKGNEYQLLNIELPDVQIKAGVECTIGVNVLSRDNGFMRINLYDNGNHVSVGKEGSETNDYQVQLTKGTQVVPLTYKFEKDGMHELKVELISVANGADDSIEDNNVYFTYANLEVFKKVLVIETYDGDSQELQRVLSDTSLLGEDGAYDVSVYNLQKETVLHYIDGGSEDGEVPQSVDDLRQYDQVILNNVSNKDLTDRKIPLDSLLYTYVYEYGGGMLTLGGNDPDGKAHAYDRKDMRRTEYQKMLPIEAVDYTPPVGVFIIVDVSGSMDTEVDGETRIHWACVGATACLSALNERDKIGIMTIGSDYADILPLTPRTEESKIREAIQKIGPMHSGTSFTPSVAYAAEQLRAAQMEKNHIIIISDLEVGSQDAADCAAYAKKCYEDEKLNLTISMVGVGAGGNRETMDIVCATREDGWISKIESGEIGCGYYALDRGNSDSISAVIFQDLKAPLITDINYKTFNPIVFNKLSQVVQGIEITGNSVNATLGGYYGVKKRNLEEVDLVLTGEYQVPLYARWKYGRGSVGSFMCDLKGGDWSGEFMSSDVGKQLIYNMIDDLMPVSNIRPREINISLNSKNYSNHLNCPTALEEGETVRGIIHTPDNEQISLNQVGEYDGCVVKRALSESNKFSVCDFLITKGGIYTIEIQKLNEEGTVIASSFVYKEFSYSKEYDVEYEKSEEEIKGVLAVLARNANGSLFDQEADADVSLIFREYETVLKYVYDPRLILMILAAVLFLLDVAVRKFKFKWIHEIVREKKAKTSGRRIREEVRDEKNS